MKSKYLRFIILNFLFASLVFSAFALFSEIPFLSGTALIAIAILTPFAGFILAYYFLIKAFKLNSSLFPISLYFAVLCIAAIIALRSLFYPALVYSFSDTSKNINVKDIVSHKDKTVFYFNSAYALESHSESYKTAGSYKSTSMTYYFTPVVDRDWKKGDSFFAISLCAYNCGKNGTFNSAYEEIEGKQYFKNLIKEEGLFKELPLSEDFIFLRWSSKPEKKVWELIQQGYFIFFIMTLLWVIPVWVYLRKEI